MMRCKTLMVRVCLLLAASMVVDCQISQAQTGQAQASQAPATPAQPDKTPTDQTGNDQTGSDQTENAQAEHAQRGTLGLDAGVTSDRFGAQPVNRDVEGNLEGRFVVLKGPDKQGAPDLVAGGEVIFPIDTNHHATELAVYVGPDFQFSHGFSGGFYGQVRKILVPPSEVNGVIFNRSNMELFEIPVFAQYKFGPARRAFVQAQISPEFSPRFKNTSTQGPSPLPNPDLDHGYAIKGAVGYNFGKWYAKATYSTRYFKFRPGISNPSDLYNWRTDVVTGGVGFVF